MFQNGTEHMHTTGKGTLATDTQLLHMSTYNTIAIISHFFFQNFVTLLTLSRHGFLIEV